MYIREMKANVIKRFTCVHTRVPYQVGSTYESNDKRIAELTALGYVEAISELPLAHIPKAEKKPKKNG